MKYCFLRVFSVVDEELRKSRPSCRGRGKGNGDGEGKLRVGVYL